MIIDEYTNLDISSKKKYRLRHREILSQKQKEYYLADRENRLKNFKLWRKNHPDKVKEYNRKWHKSIITTLII